MYDAFFTLNALLEFKPSSINLIEFINERVPERYGNFEALNNFIEIYVNEAKKIKI